MPITLTYTGELIITSCWCGIRVAIPKSLYREARERGHEVYCPIGHTFVWNETEADRLRAEVERLANQKRWANERLAAERDLRQHTERQLSAQKGATTRAKKRAAAALCPCCNRSFVQLRRHLATKHPDYNP